MTAQATRDAGADEESKTARRTGAAISPRVWFGWLLRIAAVVAPLAGIAGLILVPGVIGNASEPVVEAVERGSTTLDVLLIVLLLALILEGALSLYAMRDVPGPARVVLIGGAAAVVCFAVPAIHERIEAAGAVLIAAFASAVSLAGAFGAARKPHTRAVAGILSAFALEAIARLAAWKLATRAGETANVQLFATSRGMATVSVLLDAAGQLVAVTWLGTRGKWYVQTASMAALAGALAITWGVASGIHSGAATWQAIVHSALVDAPGVPAPLGLDALATFLVPASLLLAVVVAAQRGQPTAVVASMALALVSHGALDAPLCALCAVVAAQWAALASADDRAMWKYLRSA